MDGVSFTYFCTDRIKRQLRQKLLSLRRVLIVGLLSVGGGTAVAQPWPQIALTSPISGFQFPVHIAHAGDGSGRLFVVELGGRVRVVKNGVLLATPFLNITGKAGCSQGLLSVAFPPGYAGKGHFYVNYTDAASCNLVVSRFSLTADPDIADASSEQVVISVPRPPDYLGPAIFHSGGELAFGPDGFLYFGIGDGDTGREPGDFSNLAQDLGSLRGKILRLDVESGNPTTYVVPASNPFVATSGARPEIWALGVRNPWRSSFDRQTGDYYIGDVGQNLFEEVNFQPAGSAGGLNYGWRIMEGSLCHDPQNNCDPTGSLTLPVGGYTNTRPIDCSITGGKVYRGAANLRLSGIYVYGDYCSGKIWGLRRQNGTWQSTLLRDQAAGGQPITSEGLISFGEDQAGEIYVTDSRAGQIYLITDVVSNSTDSNHDFRISLLELTRVIELYNTRNGTVRTGCYAVATTTTEDGFAPDPTRGSNAPAALARYHSADSNSDGKISLLELTRVIELYNYRSGSNRTGQYRVQAGTEDWFSPGP